MAIKGSVFRPLPDWYNARCAWASGGYAGAFPPHTIPIVGLYNNATDGSTLWLYWLSMHTSQASTAFTIVTLQSQLGTFIENGQPVVSDQATLPGQILYGDLTSAAFFQLPLGPVFGAFNTLLDPQWETGFPLAILKPGAQLCVTGIQPDNFTASFLWAAMPPGQQ